MTNAYLSTISTLDLHPRKEQEALFENIVSKLTLDDHAALMQASTGVGKTIAIASSAIELTTKNHSKNPPIVVIAAPTIALCREYKNLFNSLDNDISTDLLLSYRNFFCKKKIEVISTNCCATPEELNILNKMTSWKGAIDEFLIEYAELPLNLTQNDVCQSNYTVTEEYEEQRRTALSADIIITTHAMIVNDVLLNNRILKFSDRDSYLIVDEADALIDTLQEAQKRNFNVQRELSPLRDLITAKGNNEIDEIIMSLKQKLTNKIEFSLEKKELAETVIKEISHILKKYKKRQISAPDQIFYRDFESYIEYFSEELRQKDQVAASLTKVNKEPTLAIFNPYFSRVFGSYLFRTQTSVALISGTLSVDTDIHKGTQWVVRELNLEQQTVSKSDFTPTRFGELDIFITRTAETMYEHNVDSNTPVKLSSFWATDIARQIDKIQGKTLVVTSSFKEAEMIGSLLLKSNLTHKVGQKLSVIKKQFLESNDYEVLISPSAHTGVNFTVNNRSVLENIVITRLGFQPRNELLANLTVSETFSLSKINAIKKNEHFMLINKVIRRSIQILGRGIRNENDKINLHILAE